MAAIANGPLRKLFLTDLDDSIIRNRRPQSMTTEEHQAFNVARATALQNIEKLQALGAPTPQFGISGFEVPNDGTSNFRNVSDFEL